MSQYGQKCTGMERPEGTARQPGCSWTEPTRMAAHCTTTNYQARLHKHPSLLAELEASESPTQLLYFLNCRTYRAVSITILSVSASASLPTSCTISFSSSSFCNTSLQHNAANSHQTCNSIRAGY